MSTFSLTPLRYALTDLEPIIDAATMDKHYNKHHKAYVDNLNVATNNNANGQTLEQIFSNSNNELSTPAIRNNGGGHYNHELYWDILSPTSTLSSITDKSIGIIDKLIAQYGSLDSVKDQVVAAGMGRFGSGWVWVSVNPTSKDLFISSTPNQDNPLMNLPEIQQGIPVIGLDVWEHAYYLKYQNLRKDYLEAVWTLLDWNRINARYEDAIK